MNSHRPRQPQRLRQILALVLAILLSLLVVWAALRFQRELARLGSAGLLGLFIVSIIGNATFFVPVPVVVVACAVAPAFGWVGTGLVNGIGSTIGEVTGYMAGYGGSAIIPQGAMYQRLEQFMQRHGMLAIFLFALIPNPVFDMAGAISGALKLPVWKFVVAAGLGKTIRMLVGAYACVGGLPWLEQFIRR
jgi:membrane protein YqaA with SNARE-associated domain